MKKTILPLLLIVASFFCTTLLYAQNIGIGTTTPQAPLHVKTNTSSEVLRVEGLNPFISFWDNITGFRGSIVSRSTYMDLYNGLPITISPGFTPSATFLNNGHVGIGTPTPSERLHVIHTADVNKNAIYGYASQTSSSTDYQNTGVTGFGQGNGVAAGFGYGFGVKGIGSLNSFGAVGIYAGLGTTIPQNNLIGGSFYSLYADAGTPAGNRYAGVFLNGNVGIGNATPVNKLDVNGDINVTGTIKTNGNPGTTGQLLVSNGTVAPTWQTPALPNNTRFSTQMPTSNATNDVAGFMSFLSYYNTNGTDITIGSDFITINKTGLYHFEGNIIYTVEYSSSAGPSYSPVFSLNFHAGSTVYNLIDYTI